MAQTMMQISPCHRLLGGIPQGQADLRNMKGVSVGYADGGSG